MIFKYLSKAKKRAFKTDYFRDGSSYHLTIPNEVLKILNKYLLSYKVSTWFYKILKK